MRILFVVADASVSPAAVVERQTGTNFWPAVLGFDGPAFGVRSQSYYWHGFKIGSQVPPSGHMRLGVYEQTPPIPHIPGSVKHWPIGGVSHGSPTSGEQAPVAAVQTAPVWHPTGAGEHDPAV